MFKNIKSNLLENTKLCDVCGERFEYGEYDFSSKYCDECRKENERRDARERKRKQRILQQK